MSVIHRNLTGDEIHEPKGASTAEEDAVYTSNGLGSGSWTQIPSIDPEDVAIPVGTTGFYGGSLAPAGWSFCFGQELSRSTYSALFSVIGTTFGAGNGTTTFNLPDLRGRAIEAKNSLSSVGDNRGTQAHAITTSETPSATGSTNTTGSHSHTVSTTTGFITSGSSYDGGIFGLLYGSLTSVNFSSAGSHSHSIIINAGSPNSPHLNVQPTAIVNVIIWHGVS